MFSCETHAPRGMSLSASPISSPYLNRIAHAQVRRTFYALSSRVRFVPQVVRTFLCFFQSMRED